MERAGLSPTVAWSVYVKSTFLCVSLAEGHVEGDDEVPPVPWFSEPGPGLCAGADLQTDWLSATTDAPGSEPASEMCQERDAVATCSSPTSAESFADVADLAVEQPPGGSAAASAAEPASTSAIQCSDAAVAEGFVELSLGSVYHPHLCSQACKWMKAGHCEAGASCGFCHLPHKRSQRNSVVLDKQNRELVRKLTGVELGSLLRPVLAEKVAELSLGPCASVALEEWSGAVVAAVSGREKFGGLAPSELRRFSRCLRAQPLNVLCRVYNTFSDRPDLSGHLSEVFANLQALAVGSVSRA